MVRNMVYGVWRMAYAVRTPRTSCLLAVLTSLLTYCTRTYYTDQPTHQPTDPHKVITAWGAYISVHLIMLLAIYLLAPSDFVQM